MSEEANRMNDIADRIIAEFRAENPDPSPRAWMALAAAHPQVAGEIADAAMIHRAVHPLDDEDWEAPLDQEAFDAGVSKVINRVCEIPSPVLRAVQEKIAEVQGPGVRTLARLIGLGSAPALLSGVLVGAIDAPLHLLDSLARHFGSSTLVLKECFQRSRIVAPVPAFKAESGKPGMSTQPTPWAMAVKSLQLPRDETERLLQLGDRADPL